MQHAVIMAGGAGTRMWPLSRRKRPKHFLKLIDGKSLLRTSFERLVSFLPPEQINVITSTAHLDLMAEEIPELPPENLIGEPAVPLLSSCFRGVAKPAAVSPTARPIRLLP